MSKPGSQKFFNACSTGKVEVVRDFLASGVDPESRDSNRLTGLIWAGRKGHIDIAEVLLAHGAKVETGDISNRTALFHAVTYQRYEFVKFLAARGADLSPVDTHGWSPLDFSQSSCHKKMVDLLSSLGARSARNGPVAEPECPGRSMRTAQSPEDTLREWATHLDSIRQPDTTAKPFVDVMSDALVWPDEINGGTPTKVIWALRFVWHHRTGLILREARPHGDFWQLAGELSPHWVGFHPERCSPCAELAEMYARSKRKRTGLG